MTFRRVSVALLWAVVPLWSALAAGSASEAFSEITAIRDGVTGDEDPMIWVMTLLAFAAVSLLLAMAPCVLVVCRRLKPSIASAGWYPDPSGQAGQRWFEGQVWSTATR
jgi:Protein of unknown function (DUF2510)